MASRGTASAGIGNSLRGTMLLPDPETSAERLEILGLLAQEESIGPLVIHAAQWAQEVPSARALAKSVLSLAKGDRVVLLEAGEKLINAGYERVAQVSTRGQFAIRGGIMDVFSWQASLPMRIELDDEVVDSIRRFDPDTQISIGESTACEILAGNVRCEACSTSSLSSERRSDYRCRGWRGAGGCPDFE